MEFLFIGRYIHISFVNEMIIIIMIRAPVSQSIRTTLKYHTYSAPLEEKSLLTKMLALTITVYQVKVGF